MRKGSKGSKSAGNVKKKKFAGAMTFLVFYILMLCAIYIPWTGWLPIAHNRAQEADEPATTQPAPSGNNPYEQMANERFGTQGVPEPDRAWYNDSRLFMLLLYNIRVALSRSIYTIAVLVAVLPLCLIFFMK